MTASVSSFPLRLNLPRDSSAAVEAAALWSRTTESDSNSEGSDGTVYPPDFQVNFLSEPGRRYPVSITAVVSGDQSGLQPILAFPSWSEFTGCISASVPFLDA
jgi:hypothetical protein